MGCLTAFEAEGELSMDRFGRGEAHASLLCVITRDCYLMMIVCIGLCHGQKWRCLAVCSVLDAFCSCHAWLSDNGGALVKTNTTRPRGRVFQEWVAGRKE